MFPIKSENMKSIFVLSSVTVLAALIIMVQPCMFQFDNILVGRNPNYKRKIYPAKLSPDKACVCGQETSYKGKTWVVFINITFQTAAPKQCMGTVIAHNLVVTSHKCLAEKDKHIFPYETWQPLPAHRDEHVASFENMTIVTFQQKVYSVKTIAYNLDYSLSTAKELMTNDIAILVVDGDLFEIIDYKDENGVVKSRGHLSLPVCLPGKDGNTKFLKDTKHRYGYYYGIEGDFVDDVAPELRVANELVIFDGNECDEQQNFTDFSSKGSLCTRAVVSLPDMEGGPLLTTNVSGHLNVPADGSLRLESQTSFLIGISTIAKMHPAGKLVEYTYYSNVLQNLNFIEWTAKQHNSWWCSTPQLSVTSKSRKLANSEDLEVAVWPWETESSKPREEKLNCACGLKYDPPKVSKRVAGGEDAVPHEFGWMVKFVFSWKVLDDELDEGAALCGASIINTRVILTSAHCVVEEEDTENHNNVAFELIKSHKVWVNSHRFESNDTDAKEVKVRDIIVHPAYIPNRKIGRVSFDLALLILDEPLTFATGRTRATMRPADIRPICLPKADEKIELKSGTFLTDVGWGLVNPYDDDPDFPDVLQKVQVPIQDKKDCSEHYLDPIPETIICVGNLTSGLALGDSGGPAAYRKSNGRYFQVGVHSHVRDVDFDDDEGEQVKWMGFILDLQQFLPFIEYYSNLYKARWCNK